MKLEQWLTTELGQDIWHKKYQNGNETFDQWLDRISNKDKEVRQLILDKKFLFGGRILAARGVTDRKVTYSNCYVLPPVGDSIEDIYDTAKHLARTFSYGGGCGIDISELRPKGSPVNNSARTTTGAVSFMDTFSQVSSTIGQQGRRGALMISMDANHADINDFINAKTENNKLEGCNISVRADSLFMTRVLAGDGDAVATFQSLVKNNWDWAEPGMLYWDNINNHNLLTEYIKRGLFSFAGVNPCAEEPLPAGGSCLLGAINLAEFVCYPFTDKAAFDIPEFKRVVHLAVKALNKVLDEGLELHPLQIQKQSVGDWRQIGLGIMGFADCLMKLGIEYGSERCLKLIDTIGAAMVDSGIKESAHLANKLGPFKKFDSKLILKSEFVQRNVKPDARELIRTFGLRNSQLFTIAPTGTISTMLGVSGGVEPIFDYAYTRTTKSLHGKDEDYMVLTPIVQQVLNRYGINSKNIQDVELPKEIVWSKTINPIDRVMTQAAWQRYIDASISSTINLPESATEVDVANLYVMAYQTGCKGITIFREGCKREAILKSAHQQAEEKVIAEAKIIEDEVQEKVHVDTSIENCRAYGSKIQTGCGSLWITAYFHKETGQLCHIFLDKGSQGGCNSFMVGLSRLISLAGKKGSSIDEIVDQLESTIACPSYISQRRIGKEVSPGNCCPGAIGKELKHLYNLYKDDFKSHEAVAPTAEIQDNKVQIAKCPECGADLSFTGGCITCFNCGYSKCE